MTTMLFANLSALASAMMAGAFSIIAILTGVVGVRAKAPF